MLTYMNVFTLISMHSTRLFNWRSQRQKRLRFFLSQSLASFLFIFPVGSSCRSYCKKQLHPLSAMPSLVPSLCATTCRLFPWSSVLQIAGQSTAQFPALTCATYPFACCVLRGCAVHDCALRECFGRMLCVNVVIDKFDVWNCCVECTMCGCCNVLYVGVECVRANVLLYIDVL